MFSFHKPKIYRSISGCCICRAKSSSSRFTDSKKYESEFEKCFRIEEKRSGEICNACVLLVKRWKKLPSGTNKNWHHVVDARAGPGTKSLKSNAIINHQSNCSTTSRNNKSNENPIDNVHTNKKRRLVQSQQHSSKNMTIRSGSNKSISSSESEPSDIEEDGDDDCMIEDGMIMNVDETEDRDDEDSNDTSLLNGNRRQLLRRSSRLAATNTGNKSSIYDDQDLSYRRNENHLNEKIEKNLQLSATMIRRKNPTEIYRNRVYREHLISFIDASIWKREKICCGIIFKGPNNEVLIYPELFQPCNCRSSSSSSVTAKHLAKNSSHSMPVSIEDKQNHSITKDNTDDQSSGIISMGQCDDNSIQDSISDRLSTVSSSLLDDAGKKITINCLSATEIALEEGQRRTNEENLSGEIPCHPNAIY
ncbi:Gly 6-like protein [Sarcoptes scabiei]|nr:Gly 6-like protein [Sarcoptes scabiei]